MKSEWSNSWKSSMQPRKQRKFLFNAPAHIKQKKMTAPLSKTLRKEHNKRSLVVRVGDEVKIVRGDFKGKKGKVEKIIKPNERVIINNVSRVKVDGTKANAPVHASKIMITKINLEDSKRIRSKK
ncbi:MAG: 50S ribosomal protein L24 [Nanoarchaeota archaeon]|nr:50S ribosomal protein L24 [Nanoarchaeota archaeon]